MAGDFVIDNTVVMAWCFQDEANPYADAVLEQLTTSGVTVPASWPLEVGNILLAAERNNRLSEADITRLVALLKKLPLTVEQDTPLRAMGEILMLAREHRLSTFEASYLDLAMRGSMALATLNQNLRYAATKCRVPILDK